MKIIATFFVGPLLGVISSIIGWNGVLILQIVVSFLAGAAAHRAHYIENHPQRNKSTDIDTKVAETTDLMSPPV